MWWGRVGSRERDGIMAFACLNDTEEAWKDREREREPQQKSQTQIAKTLDNIYKEQYLNINHSNKKKQIQESKILKLEIRQLTMMATHKEPAKLSTKKSTDSSHRNI